MFLQDLLKSQKKKSYWKIRLVLQNDYLKGGTVYCVRSSFLYIKSGCTCTQMFLKILYLLAKVKLIS